MSNYRVYTVVGTNRRTAETRTFKFGITKTKGERRPRSQYRKCRGAFGPDWDCTHVWLRDDMAGWLKARRMEAMYAARYKDFAGDFPVGMKKGL